MFRAVAGTIGLFFLASCAMTPPVSSAARAQIAPTGTLRAGVNFGNPVVASKDPVTGELRGVPVDLVREAGRRLGVPVEIIGFDIAAKIFDALLAGTIDVGTLAYDSGRDDILSFTGGYVRVEATYLVPPGSPIKTVADVDREGVRVGVSANSAYQLYLGRTFEHAQLVGGQGVPGTAQMLYAGKVDVMAAQKHQLETAAQKMPGSRVLDGYFLVIEQTLAIPKGRDAAIQYLRDIVEEGRAAGFVTKSASSDAPAAAR